MAKRTKRLVMIIMAIVLIALIPTQAFAAEFICGEEEHEHTDECYALQELCPIDAHEHSDECKHIHTDECGTACGYEDGQIICGKEEHSHEGEEFERVVICSASEHKHTEECEALEDGSILTSKTASDLEEGFSSINLTVGGSSENLSSDVILVLGADPAGDHEYITSLIKKMLIGAEGTEAKIKLGIVGFADTTADETILPLTEMKETDAANADPSDMDYIITSALDAWRTSGKPGGVNFESAFNTAKAMMDADTSVPVDRKHIIAISTGLTYWYDDEEGNPSTIIGKNEGTVAGTNEKFDHYAHGNKYWLKARLNYTSTGYGYIIPYGLTWEEYWSYVCQWVEADGDTYQFTLQDGKTYYEFASQNSGEFVPTVNGKPNRSYRYGSYMKNPEDIANAESGQAVPYFAGGTSPFGSTAASKNAAHALNYDRAQYEAWKAWKAAQEEGLNCYSIAHGYTSEGNESTDKWLQSNQIGRNFMDMLAGGTAVVYSTYNTDFFKPIEESILCTVAAGSYVTDYIGYDPDETEGYDFDFVDDAACITLSLGDVKYTTTKTANDPTKEGLTSTYVFTAPGADDPTFALEYFRGNGKDEEHFVWSFGESASNYNAANLEYKVELVSKSEAAGEHVALTNQFAVLVPYDSEGNRGPAQFFVKPEVTYGGEDKEEEDTTTTGGNTTTRPGNTTTTIRDEEPPRANRATLLSNTETILDEEVPLAAAPKTGDNSFVLIVVLVVVALGIVATIIVDKKRKNAKNDK